MNSALRHALAALLAAVSLPALAHDAKAGDIAIAHPFATPTIPGTTTGAAYFAALENTGTVADKLVRVGTPVAARVEIHAMSVDAQGVMRMREVDGIALAPKAVVRLRPGAGMHLMLIGLKAPLKEGASFPMTLEFEKAGRVEVEVKVEAPKAGAAGEMHMH